MSTPLTLANVYTLLAHFQETGNPAVTWRSSIDMYATAQPQPTDAIIVAMQNFWTKNLRSDCELLQVELRAWTHGGPQPFSLKYPLWRNVVSLVGTKNTTYGNQGAPVGGEIVAYAQKLIGTGAKPGKMFIRALLDLYELVAAPGGRWAINLAPGNVTPAHFHSLTVAGVIDGFFGAAKNPGFVEVHVPNKGAGPASYDVITDIQLIGVSLNKQTRKNKK